VANFVWLGTVNGDLGNPKNWWNADTDAAATRTPGVSNDNNDNIWFRKSTTANKQLTGKLTSGINDVFFLAASVTNYTIGSMSATSDGITGAWEIIWELQCNDIMVGYVPGTGKAYSYTGFAADRVTFKSTSKTTATSDAYLNSGTYEGTVTGGNLYLGNAATSTFVGTSGTFKVNALANCTVLNPNSTAITVSSLNLLDSQHMVTIQNQTTTVKADEITCTSKYVELIGTFPLAANGTIKTNGSEITPKDAVGGNVKEFALTSGQTHEVITASPSQGNLSFINATYVSYPSGTTLSLGGNVVWLTQSVQTAAKNSTTVTDYGGYFAGTIVSNSASYAECRTTNTNASKYFNVYARATDALFVGEVGPGVVGNAGYVHIKNATGCTLLGPLGCAVVGTSFTGKITADIRSTVSSHVLREFTNNSNEIVFKYSGTTDFTTFATISGDMDIANTPVTFEIGNTTSGVVSSGGAYTLGNVTFKQTGTLELKLDAALEMQGNLTISGGTFESDDTINFTGAATRTVTCTANTTQQMTLTCASNTTINYDWISTAEYFPALTVNGTLKPTAATTGAANVTGSGTFNWNGGLTATNMLFYITASSGTPLSVTTISNGNYLTGYTTTFRFECRTNGSYSVTLPTAISGDVELGSSGSPGLSSGNDPIFNCPSACAITGNLKIDYSGYQNAATYNAKVNVASATNELQVTGNVTIGTRGYCAAQIKITNGDLTNNGTIASNKLTMFSNTAGIYNGNVGSSCTLVDLLIDGIGLTSKVAMTGSATLTGTYTITDAFVSLGNADITTCVNIAVTGASKCSANQHLFVMSGGGTINDSSTETRDVAGISSFAGCISLGAIKMSTGTTGIVGSVIVDSIILDGGTLGQNSTTAKKLWIRGGTHPTALANGLPGYKGSNNFTNAAINAKSGSFIFPTSGANYNVADTLIIGNANNAETHIYNTATLTLGTDPNSNINTLTLVKWNSEKGISFGPQSTYTGSFNIKRCDIEGTHDMTEALVSTYKGTIHSSTVKTLTIQENNIHSDTKEMAMVYVENTTYHKLVLKHNRFKAKAGTAIIRTKYCITTATGSEIAYNHVRSLSTNGTICELNNLQYDRTFLNENVFCSDTMTSGKGLIFAPVLENDYLTNYVLVNAGVTPVDLSHHHASGNALITGWYFDTTNSNFGKSCQGKTNKSLTSQFTNEENDYILSGILNSGRTTLVQHENYNKWKTTSGTGVLSSIILNNKTYRFARSNSLTLQSKDIYVNATVVTASWSEYDASNKIAVTANYYDGSATTTEAVTSGTALTVPASCIKLYFTVVVAQNEGFADFTVVDNESRKMFTDAQIGDLGTQTAARTEVGPLTYFSYNAPNIGGTPLPHVNAQYSDPINQSVWLYLKQQDVGGSADRKWVTLLHEQDSDDFYRFTVHQQASGSNNDVLTIDKSVAGTVTQLVTKTNCNFTAADANTDVIFKSTLDTSQNKLIISIEGTTTTDWSFTTNATDSTFATGNWGWAGDDASVLKVQVYDGIENTQMFVNGLDLIFMPNSAWKFPTTVTNVEFRDVTVNGNQASLLPNLYGTHTTALNTVSFINSVLPTSITNFIVIKDSVLTVAGDVTLSGNGKLHLIGCKITPTPARWKFNFSAITYTDSPPLLLQGNMLSGMYSTATPTNENLFVIDDETKNTAIARIQSTKDMNVTRNAILGLEFERMIFNGYDSKTLVITIQSVNDAGIIGKFEEMFMNQTTFELVTPYCHLWKAKVVGFTPRYLNNQATALQAQVTVEEWRDD